jgi:RNA polymerase subunit RPABC4/transcription elongation factor Spt4
VDTRLQVACPECGWQPDENYSWQCTCGHSWNSFQTYGVCPACAKVRQETECPTCKQSSQYESWYTFPNGVEVARYTIRARRILPRYGHIALDVEHLLLVLLEQPSDVVRSLLETLGVDREALYGRLDETLQLSRRPSAVAGARAGQLFVTLPFHRALKIASQLAEEVGDGRVFAEHMFLAVLKARKPHLHRLLKGAGVSYREALKALSDIPGPPVPSD